MDISGIERSRSAHFRMIVVGLVLALSVIALPGRAVAATGDGAGVAVALVNDSRAAYGLAGLETDAELQAVARRHADRMAERGAIYHSGDLGGRLSWGWWAWGENVGHGSSVGRLHSAFISSGSHRANILDPSFNYVGVGVAFGADGTVYTAQVFGAW